MIAAFHHVSAVLLDDPAVDHIAGDVLVLGEDRDAVGDVCELATAIPGARGIYAGRLRNAGQVEALTANLIAINRRYKAHASLMRHGPAVTQAPRHTLHIVSGKGGTGKTTIAAALACALATRGRRVLLCEVEGRNGIAELFEVPDLTGAEERRISRTPAGGTVYGLAIDAEDALLEYLDTFYHLGLAGKALDRFGAVDFATSIAPGLRDVLLTGKVYEAVRRGEKRRRTRTTRWCSTPRRPAGSPSSSTSTRRSSGLAKVGPIRNQADSIMRVLRSATTVVHLVTLLEDMPVTETEEAVAALAADPDPGRHGDREHGHPQPARP